MTTSEFFIVFIKIVVLVSISTLAGFCIVAISIIYDNVVDRLKSFMAKLTNRKKGKK